MNCICQRVYETGFTGIPRVDRRLAYRYEVYGEDCIRRAFDHANFHVPYTDAPRNHYCFITRTQEPCRHESCEHARYRPPDLVRKMRWYIENDVCKAHVHYPDLLNGIDRDGDSRPEMDNEVARRLGWDEEQYRLHRNLGFRERTPRLTAIPVETFREEVATALTDISLDAGKITEQAMIDLLRAMPDDADEYDEDFDYDTLVPLEELVAELAA